MFDDGIIAYKDLLSLVSASSSLVFGSEDYELFQKMHNSAPYTV